MTKKLIEVNDLYGGQCSVNKNIGFKTPLLRSDLCDYSDACTVLKRRITVVGTVDTNEINENLSLKNTAPRHTYQKSRNIDRQCRRS